MGKWLMRGDPQLSIHRRLRAFNQLKHDLAKPCRTLDVDEAIQAQLATQQIRFLLELVILSTPDLHRKGFSGAQIAEIKTALRPHNLRISMNVLSGTRREVRALIRRQRLHSENEKGRRSRSRRPFRSAGDEED